MNEDWSQELISAYLDGELSAEQRLRVEEHLYRNPDARQQLRDFEAIGHELQSLPRYKLKPDFEQQVMRTAGAMRPTPMITPASIPAQRWRAAGLAMAALAATLVFTMIYVPQTLSPVREAASVSTGDEAANRSPASGVDHSSARFEGAGQDRAQPADALVIGREPEFADADPDSRSEASELLEKRMQADAQSFGAPAETKLAKGLDPEVALKTAAGTDAAGEAGEKLDGKVEAAPLPLAARDLKGNSKETRGEQVDDVRLKEAERQVGQAESEATVPQRPLGSRRGSVAGEPVPNPEDSQRQYARRSNNEVVIDQLIVVGLEAESFDARKVDEALRANNIVLDAEQAADQFYGFSKAGALAEQADVDNASPDNDATDKSVDRSSQALALDALWVNATEEQIHSAIAQLKGQRIVGVPFYREPLSAQLGQPALQTAPQFDSNLGRGGRSAPADSANSPAPRAEDRTADVEQLKRRAVLGYARRLRQELELADLKATPSTGTAGAQLLAFRGREEAGEGNPVTNPDEIDGERAQNARQSGGAGGGGAGAAPIVGGGGGDATKSPPGNRLRQERADKSAKSQFERSAGPGAPGKDSGLAAIDENQATTNEVQSQRVRRYLLLIYPLNAPVAPETSSQVAPARNK